MTLYELLTLRPAFGGQDREELLAAGHAGGAASAPAVQPVGPGRPGDDRPEGDGQGAGERYATARELADDLRRFLELKPIQAERPTALGPGCLKWARRHARLVAAAFLVLLLAVGGLATGLS